MSPTPRHRKGTRHLRVMTYNILLGARYREHLVRAVIARCDPDVLALQEVTDLALVRRLAKDRHMTLLVGNPSDPSAEMYNVILSRLPVRRWRNHRHPGSMLRSHLEAELDVSGSAVGSAVRIHCLHLAARFGEKANGEARRMRELDGFFADLATLDSLPHVVVGDFNAVSPEDTVAATRFFAKMADLRRSGVLARDRNGLWGAPDRRGEVDVATDGLWREHGVPPHLDVSVPRLPGSVLALIRKLPRGHNVDRILGLFIERWSIERIRDAGYVDCFRRLHPRAAGHTCATWIPVSRIDYVFASPDMATHLDRCDVVGSRGRPDPDALAASDHWPLIADFAV